MQDVGNDHMIKRAEGYATTMSLRGYKGMQKFTFLVRRVQADEGCSAYSLHYTLL